MLVKDVEWNKIKLGTQRRYSLILKILILSIHQIFTNLTSTINESRFILISLINHYPCRWRIFIKFTRFLNSNKFSMLYPKTIIFYIHVLFKFPNCYKSCTEIIYCIIGRGGGLKNFIFNYLTTKCRPFSLPRSWAVDALSLLCRVELVTVDPCFILGSDLEHFIILFTGLPT